MKKKRKIKILKLTIFIAAVLGLGVFIEVNNANAEGIATLSPPATVTGGTYTYTVNFGRNISGVAPANLDGDSILDWVGKSTYEGGTMWLEARRTDSTFLWQFDTEIPTNLIRGGHNGMHEGFIAWDLDNDGLDEVFVIQYFNNGGSRSPYLVALNGKTGAIRSRINLPEGDGMGLETYPSNPYQMGQHYYAIAYLDGPLERPSVIVSFGIYKAGVVWAFDWDVDSDQLKNRWTYQHLNNYGTSGHGINTYDLDEDGREEVIFGGTVVRPDGKKLFSLSDLKNQYGQVAQYGHVNTMPAGDLDPSNPGNEIFFTVEQPKGENVAVAIMTTWDGMVLWKKTGYQWDAGWCVNVYPEKPGDECQAYDTTPAASLPTFFSSTGAVLPDPNPDWGTLRRPPDWTGDEIYDFEPKVYDPDKDYKFTSYSGYPCDIGGGPNHGAEEIINLNPLRWWNGVENKTVPLNSGWATIKFNLKSNPYPSRWANRHYRQDCVRGSVNGYAPTRDTFRVQPESNNDMAAPTIPQNLIAVAKSPAGADLSWSASTDDVGVGGYKIARCEGTGCAPIFTGYAFNARTNYSDNGLLSDTWYTYSVAAYDASGKVSGLSDSVAVRILPTITEKKIQVGDSWNYYKGISTPDVSWTGLSFTGSWSDAGSTPIGRGQSGDYTTMLTGTNYTTFYARKNFNINDASVITSMRLSVGYDDGFVAYVNGTEVARSGNMTTVTPNHTTTTDGSTHEVTVIDPPYDLSTDSLRNGDNVLAIEIHNKNTDAGDIGIRPEMEITLITESNPADINSDDQVNIKDIQICIKGIIDQNSIPDTQLQKCQAVAPPLDVVNIKDVQGIIREIIK